MKDDSDINWFENREKWRETGVEVTRVNNSQRQVVQTVGKNDLSGRISRRTMEKQMGGSISYTVPV